MCRRFREIVLEKKPFGDFGDLEKIDWRNCGRRFGENRSAMLYWSSLRSIIVLGDRMWSLRSNGEKVETNCGDQNFIHCKVKNTYLECIKDRTI